MTADRCEDVQVAVAVHVFCGLDLIAAVGMVWWLLYRATTGKDGITHA